jgi:hypothetical protein
MYTRIQEKHLLLITDSKGTPIFFNIKDGPSSNQSGQDLLRNYIDEARGMFKTECDILLSTDRPFTDLDSNRLTSMLRLLIDARKTWQEEEAHCCAPTPLAIT